MGEIDDIRAVMLPKFRAVTDERLSRLHELATALVANDASEQTVTIAMREAHTFKGESRMLGFVLASRVVHRVEDVLASAQPAPHRLSDAQFAAILEGLRLIEFLVGHDTPLGTATPEVQAYLERSDVQGPASEQRPSLAGEAASTQEAKAVATRRRAKVLGVGTDDLSELSALGAELQIYHARAQRVQRTLASQVTQLRDLSRALSDNSGGAGALDQLGRAMATTVTSWREDLLESSNRVGALNDTLERVRLVPLSSITDRYPAVIHSLGREQGKEIGVVVHGADVAVDQDVLDALQEPLIHLIRNAVDHGVESPQERVEAGKAPKAQVWISAHQYGNHVDITVRDDGRGVDVGAVAVAAVRRGLLMEQTAKDLDQEAALELIFRAHFSTREVAGEVSGRGVGLDAVKRSVEALGGAVQIQSTPGAGTTFRLTVPITAALTRALVLCEHGLWFGLPSTSVREIRDVEQAPHKSAAYRDSIECQGVWVPVFTLAELLDLDAHPDAIARVAIVAHDNRHIAIAVASGASERPIVRKGLDRFVGDGGAFNGTAQLEDGQLVYLLNVPALFAGVSDVTAEVATEGPNAMPVRRGRIMIVDDSDLTRDMLAVATRRFGFEITEAVNGRDALERLDDDLPDLIVTDLDMPVLDGFDLIQELRERSDTQQTPVIVLSTRGSDADKQRAMLAGANAYLVKSSFKTDEFVDLLHLFMNQR